MPISAPNVGEEFENLVGNRTLALRTERIVLDGLGLADEFSNRKVPSWDRAERRSPTTRKGTAGAFTTSSR